MHHRTGFGARIGASLRQCAVALAVLALAPATPVRAQEFRAAWVDIFHAGMSNQGEVDTLVSTLASANYNAVVVQVLGYMDRNGTASHGAHWKSSILPWSTRVTSSFDPLAYLCTQAHANGIEVHAWIGGSGGAMYRVSLASGVFPPVGNPTLINHPEWFIAPLANSEGGAPVPVDSYYSLDMGSPDVQEYLVSIVRELVTNYPIDGINWDDEINGAGYTAGFGYPAHSQANYARSGLARFRINTGYVGTPGNTDAAWSNYRRRFKNELMARVQAEIQSIKSNPRQPLRHTTAALAYSPVPGSCDFATSTPYLYYCDWAGMLQNGWVDAVIPQTYSSSTFNSWADRITACWVSVRPVFMGMAGGDANATIASEISYLRGKGLNGYATYSYYTAAAAWWPYAAANLNTSLVGTPPMPWRNPATATEGIMWGRVQDAQTSLYVDDATVTVTGGPTVKTDGNGYYVATLVPATAGGTVHSTTASKSGTTSHTIANATALPGDIVRYDFTLKAVTTTALASITPDPVCAGAAVSVTATATGAYGPTGQVEFFDGTTSLGTATLQGGSATKSVSSLAVGTHSSITAAYLGDTQNNPSTSAAGSVTVQATPTAPDAGYTRNQGASLKIRISDLTPDTLASLGTPAHGTVSNDGTYIFYTPGDHSDDSFTYTAANTYCSKQATVTVTVVPVTGQAQTPVVPESGPVTVGFAGIPDYPYQAQRATDLGFTTGLRTWTTNAPGTGVFQIEDDFSDLGTRPSSAWYRLKYNP